VGVSGKSEHDQAAQLLVVLLVTPLCRCYEGSADPPCLRLDAQCGGCPAREPS
jgi:hypothetical protein